MSATALFIALPVSPWSEKARWALDHHSIRYTERLHVPLMGEPLLRWRLRRLRGRITVPLLLADGQAFTDSYDIAHFAERTGHGAPLFLRGHEAETDHWNQVSERVMSAGRSLFTGRALGDREAKQESLRGVVPRPFRRALAPLAGVAMRFIQRKHHVPRHQEDTVRDGIRASLGELRRALSDGRRYILGQDFSYADIAMAAALQMIVAPPPECTEHLHLGPGLRRSATDLELAGELTDLAEWRDQLYINHRGTAPVIHHLAATPA